MSATQPSPRILIVRLSAMGDVIHAMPAVAALRAAHPCAHIGWAIEPAWVPLLFSSQSHPLVDAIHRVPGKRWSRSLMSLTTLREMRQMRHEIAAARYDIALDLQGNLRSGIITGWSHAPRRVGESHPRESIARLFTSERVAHTRAHIIEQDLELASAIGNAPLTYRAPQFPGDDQSDAWARATLAPYARKEIAFLMPGAGWGAKRWPAERYGAVAAALGVSGFHFFINAGPGETPLANEVIRASGEAATVLQASLPQLIAMLRRTQLCIAGDTGPLHLACALQVPTIGIYGPTDPARNGPYGTQFRVLRSQSSARDHTRRGAPERGLLTITAQDVLAAARELLPAIKLPAIESPEVPS